MSKGKPVDGRLLGIQGPNHRRFFLNLCGNLAPDFFASQVAAKRKLRRSFFDSRVSIETITRPAKSRIHHNGIFMRRPHTQLPQDHPLLQSNWSVSDETSGKSEL